MEQAMQWRPIKSAPKDGSRIIVAIRASEQGTADVDIVRWSRPRKAADDCWVSTDSTHDCTIIYDEREVVNWMPLPDSMPGVRTPNLASTLPDFPRNGQETGGSGI